MKCRFYPVFSGYPLSNLWSCADTLWPCHHPLGVGSSLCMSPFFKQRIYYPRSHIEGSSGRFSTGWCKPPQPIATLCSLFTRENGNLQSSFKFAHHDQHQLDISVFKRPIRLAISFPAEMGVLLAGFQLVGGCTNPFEKICSSNGSFPQSSKNIRVATAQFNRIVRIVVYYNPHITK